MGKQPPKSSCQNWAEGPWFPSPRFVPRPSPPTLDRKSTRLNSSHLVISYAVFCLKKKISDTGPAFFSGRRRCWFHSSTRREVDRRGSQLERGGLGWGCGDPGYAFFFFFKRCGAHPDLPSSPARRFPY